MQQKQIILFISKNLILKDDKGSCDGFITTLIPTTSQKNISLQVKNAELKSHYQPV